MPRSAATALPYSRLGFTLTYPSDSSLRWSVAFVSQDGKGGVRSLDITPKPLQDQGLNSGRPLRKAATQEVRADIQQVSTRSDIKRESGSFLQSLRPTYPVKGIPSF